MKHIAILGRLAILGGLLLTSLATPSCDRRKDPEVQHVELINVQLKSFAITSDEDKTLAEVPFTIEHTAEMGKVANAVPFAYGKQLKKVKFVITPEVTDTRVQIALGNTSFIDWKTNDVFDLPDELTQIRLRLFVKDDTREFAYDYMVKLNRYKYDPQTIEWQSVPMPQTPAFTPEQYAYALEAEQGASLIISGADTRMYSYGAAGVAERAMPVLGGGAAQIKHIEHYGDAVYALGRNGTLYMLKADAWQPIAVDGASIVALLGVLPPRITSDSPDVALLLRTASGKEQFALYTGGKLKVSALDVPQGFPKAGYRTFASSRRYVGGSLRLVASQTLAGKVQRSVWYTTNGLDWSLIHEGSVDGALASNSILAKDDLLYEFRTYADRGLEISTSADEGKTWVVNGSIALPREAGTYAGRPVLVWSHAEAHTIGMLVGVDSKGGGKTQVQIGKLRKDDF